MIQDAVAVFVGSLNASWAALQGLSDSSEYKGLSADWAQASWEAIVEASLPLTSPPIRLEVYGDGADCHSRSSRFSFPEALPTHAVHCKAVNDFAVDRLSGKPITTGEGCYIFDRFVSVRDGWYFEEAPFDHALLVRGGIEYVVALSGLEWEVVRIE